MREASVAMQHGQASSRVCSVAAPCRRLNCNHVANPAVVYCGVFDERAQEYGRDGRCARISCAEVQSPPFGAGFARAGSGSSDLIERRLGMRSFILLVAACLVPSMAAAAECPMALQSDDGRTVTISLYGEGSATDSSFPTRAYVVRLPDRFAYLWKTESKDGGGDGWTSGTSPPAYHEGRALFITWTKPMTRIGPVRVAAGPLAGDWRPLSCDRRGHRQTQTGVN
jgi:hypothetical protein